MLKFKLLLISLLLVIHHTQGLQLDSLSLRITGKHGSIQNEVQLGAFDEVHDNGRYMDIPEINEGVDEIGLIDGDIIPSESRNAVTDTTKYWPTTIIPVAYGPTLPLLNIAGIEEARLEYEMRTCLSFVDRTDEDDYIIFQLRSGCYSSVGKVGGAQTISIGLGCDWRSVVQHEMMHAIGIYHEQSRPDRDNYVEIQTQNIDTSKLNNFVKYNYKRVDDKRVSYDYESVMHYDDSGFSNNGEKTILTKDPAFQGVIGQRRTFSIGDVEMINRMYPCGDPLRHSYSCGFEAENVCGYVQDEEDELNFIHASIQETPQLNTDNTYGEKDRGNVMLLDTSYGVGVANMVSMRLHKNASTQCLHFSYYMDFASKSDEAGISASIATINQVTGEIISTESLVTVTEHSGKYWNLERLTFKAPAEHYKLVFTAKNGNKDDVIAIDDVLIQDKPCDSAFIQIHDYSEVLSATAANKTGFRTERIYTDAGYAFKLLIYPSGHPSGTDGYMGLFFGLTSGEYDDQLEWPFTNQVIRLQVEDQNPNVLLRMSQFIQYMTEDGQPVWDKPAPGEDGQSYGYYSFMKISDIVGTRDYMKNDAIVISVNVRDMRDVARLQKEKGEKYDHDIDSHKQFNSDQSYQKESSKSYHSDSEPHQIENMMSLANAILIALSCSFFVFILMVIILLCISATHRKSIAAVASVNAKVAKKQEKRDYHNLVYMDGEKV